MKVWQSIRKGSRKYLLVGLIVSLPFVVTIKFLIFIVDYFDGILAISNERFLYILPAFLHPDRLLHVHVPGLGLILTILFLFLVGVLSRNFFGRYLIDIGDRTLARVPLAGAVYKIVKELTNTYSKRDKTKFSRVVLIEYPRRGIYAMAFVTGGSAPKFEKLTEEKSLNVFLPTTPNPTSGFYLIIPEKETMELDVSVEQAFKLIVSAGMVPPNA